MHKAVEPQLTYWLTVCLSGILPRYKNKQTILPVKMFSPSWRLQKCKYRYKLKYFSTFLLFFLFFLPLIHQRNSYEQDILLESVAFMNANVVLTVNIIYLLFK